MPEAIKSCPMCGETILAVARKCRFCRHYLDPQLRRENAPTPSAADRMLMPVGRPPSAIAAGYLGLLSFLPLVGILLGLMAVIFGVRALGQINRDEGLSGRGRAWFGIIVGGLVILAQVALIVVIVIEESSRRF